MFHYITATRNLHLIITNRTPVCYECIITKGVRGGACAATALVKDGELFVANVGDCRAVLGSHSGIATALTSDHTAGREDERRRIESSVSGDRDGHAGIAVEPVLMILHTYVWCGYICREGT